MQIDINRIAQLVIEQLQREDSKKEQLQPNQVRVGVSARHLHLSQEDLEKLFGHGYQLKKLRDLSMMNEWAAVETVTLVGANLRTIEKVRILGPVRKATQVEISRTDAHFLGLSPPIRPSGEVKNSSPITIVGPYQALTIPEGCIIPNRHIHFSPQDAIRYGVKHNQIVYVRTRGERGGFLDHVQIRIKETYRTELHLDTDDANAFALKDRDIVEILFSPPC